MLFLLGNITRVNIRFQAKKTYFWQVAKINIFVFPNQVHPSSMGLQKQINLPRQHLINQTRHKLFV